MAEFIYTMRKVRKAHGDKVILDDVNLNFLPGAKIGVVGPNGAGKSSVLRIMAGLDTPNNGDAYLAPGASVGILQQEPHLDETKTVRENVEEGVPIKGKLNRYNEVAELMATDYSDELMEEMGRLQEELDAADAWDIDSQLEQAMASRAVGTTVLWTGVVSAALFLLLKYTIGLRPSADAEREGLDLSEHGERAYNY